MADFPPNSGKIPVPIRPGRPPTLKDVSNSLDHVNRLYLHSKTGDPQPATEEEIGAAAMYSHQLLHERIPAEEAPPWPAPLLRSVQDMNNSITNMNDNITDINANIAILRTDVDAMKADVTELKAQVTGLEGDIAKIRTDTTETKGSIAEAHGDIVAMKQDITEVKANLAQIQPNVDTLLLKSEELLVQMANSNAGPAGILYRSSPVN